MAKFAAHTEPFDHRPTIAPLASGEPANSRATVAIRFGLGAALMAMLISSVVFNLSGPFEASPISGLTLEEILQLGVGVVAGLGTAVIYFIRK